MKALLKLVVGAAAICGAPGLAAAQAWLATATSSVQAQPRPILPFAAERPVSFSGAAASNRSIVLRRSLEAGPRPQARTEGPAAAQTPKMELRPKEDWTDDQGVSLTARGVTYKQRF